MNAHPREQLSAWLDGELAPAAMSEVEQHLRNCTECSRELAIMRHLGGVMRSMPTRQRQRSVWDAVHRRISRPVGWILLLAGLAVWTALALAAWLRQAFTLEWAAASAIGIGLFLLLVGIGYEQYRAYKETRYKDVQR